MQIDLSIFLKRSVVSCGDQEPVKTFLNKLNTKQPITYCAIGGSITEGAAASSPEMAYVSLFAEWLNKKTDCKCINAGIGATTSMLGAYRAANDILFAVPDVITIEFAVNDIRNPDTAGSFECLVRQCINQPQNPLVILIFTMWHDGSNLQDIHIPIGRHYGLPMLSYRDAIYPEIIAERISWKDISPDEVHPNDKGHCLIAEMVEGFIQLSNTSMCSTGIGKRKKHPAPLLSSAGKYENGKIIDASQIKVVSSIGWTQQEHDTMHTGWRADTPGAMLVLELTGSTIIIGYRKYAKNYGKVSVNIDGIHIKNLDGYFEKDPVSAWAGGHTILEVLLFDQKQSPHIVEITMLKNDINHISGEVFELGYFLIS